MTSPKIRIHNLGKFFRVPRARSTDDPRRQRISRRTDRFWALRDINLTIEPGQTIGLIGANGSGKSTLLKILAGVMQPDTGSFTVADRIGALLELGAGFHPDLSGLENVYLNGAMLGFDAHEIDELLPRVIEFAELERFMDMPVRHYSSGMSGRLGFSIASCLAPEVLLLDETFATGDAGFQYKAMRHIFSIKDSGTTMIVVSHHLEVIRRLADRIVWLDRGRIYRDGDPQPVLAEYRRHLPASHRQGEDVRGALGVEAIFEDLLPDNPGVRLADVRLATEGADGDRRDAAALLDVAMGATVLMDVTIEHPADPPAVAIETAWLTEDGNVMAQSRTAAPLRSGRPATTVRLSFDRWPLTEGRWRAAVALAPGIDHAAGTPSPGYYDRRREIGGVRVTSPLPFYTPVIAAVDHQWHVA